MLGWSKKSAIENVTGKHVTNGSVVVCVSTGRGDHAVKVPYGAKGKVVATGKANAWACKKALGTTEGMQVEWDETQAKIVGPVLVQGQWQVALGAPGAYVPEEPGGKPAPFDSKAHAEASFKSYQEIHG